MTIQERGGIAQDGRGRRGRGARVAAARSNDVERVELPAVDADPRHATAAAPTATAASPPIPASAPPRTCSSPRAAPAILGETPEIYGAEHILIDRAVSPEVGEKLVERIKWWEGYTSASRRRINNNPCPGNKEGGLTTIYEKSLGAIAKGGTTP